MSQYIDGFVFPIAKRHLKQYQAVAEQVASIWKEYGARSYCEFTGEDMYLTGTRSFIDAVDAKPDEVIIFGWTVFDSKEARDEANTKVPADSRMKEIVAPLMGPENPIFDARRMVYGGFELLVS